MLFPLHCSLHASIINHSICIFFAVTGNKHLSKTTVFNDQHIISVGGYFGGKTNRVERPFLGIIAGVVYNGVRPLELASAKDAKTSVHGDVGLSSSGIPFDYREKHPELFTKEALQSQIDQVFASNKRSNEGSPSKQPT